MKIITLWQPWASLIAYGLKRYETRSWPSNYQGPILIHAAKRPFVKPDNSASIDHEAYRAWMLALDLAYESGLHNDQTKMPFANQLPLGAVVAIANLDDCLEMTDCSLDGISGLRKFGNRRIWTESPSPLEQAVGDWRLGRYAWALSNVQRLVEPIPWRGSQGLRDAPPDLQSLVATASKKEVSE